MPEIFPNWHPAIVHFPIALTMVASLLLLAGRLYPASSLHSAMGRRLLPFAAVSALLALGFGWQAYQTVEHDAAGHLVMLRHRNWALGSSIALAALALWDAGRQRAGRAINPLLLPTMLLLSASLGITGWLGGEMVFRHGIGVATSALSRPAEIPPPPEMPATSLEAAPSAGSEHIHQDGKRHRH